MGLLYASSYAGQSGYIISQIDTLEKYLIEEKENRILIKNGPLFSQINDMLVKIGFLLFSKDAISKIDYKDPLCQPYYSYYLSNFIYDCKAFLDSVAVTLNDFYKMGFSKGDIDLQKGNFLDRLADDSTLLSTEIKKQSPWISEVVKWRDDIIHRFSIVVAPYKEKAGPPTKEDDPNDIPMMMLVEPRPLHQMFNSTKTLRETHGKIMMEIIPFCDKWINQSKTLFEKTCDSIIKDLK